MKKIVIYFTMLALLSSSLGYALIGEILDTAGDITVGAVNTAGDIVEGTVEAPATIVRGPVRRGQVRQEVREQINEEQEGIGPFDEDDERFDDYGASRRTARRTSRRVSRRGNR